MFCQNCGNQLSDESKFCPYCGQQIKKSEGTENETKSNSIPSQGMNWGRPFIPLATDRNLALYILLTIVTCGIYHYIFIHQVSEDMNIACAGDGEETSGVVAYILLTIVTCGIYAWYWHYKLGNRLQANARRYGMEVPENGTTILLWLLFGSFFFGIGYFIAMHILFKNLNLVSMAYNNYNYNQE